MYLPRIQTPDLFPLIEGKTYWSNEPRTGEFWFGQVLVPAADVYLRMNGLELAGESLEHHKFIIGLMELWDLDWRAIDDWLRRNLEGS